MLDTKQTTIDQPNRTKDLLGKFFAILFFALIGGVVILAIFSNVAAKDYQPKTPLAEKHYQEWLSQKCTVEKEVAQANFEDISHGVAIEKDLNSLRVKKDKDCSPLIPEAKALSFEHSESITPVKPALRPIHKGDPEQQAYIDYAWSISHDPKFIYLLKAENGMIDPTSKSKIVGKNGYRDIGFCQINQGYHRSITNDKRFLTDPKWQLDQCLRLYKGGTKFYGINKINSVKKYFTWI